MAVQQWIYSLGHFFSSLFHCITHLPHHKVHAMLWQKDSQHKRYRTSHLCVLFVSMFTWWFWHLSDHNEDKTPATLNNYWLLEMQGVEKSFFPHDWLIRVSLRRFMKWALFKTFCAQLFPAGGFHRFLFSSFSQWWFLFCQNNYVDQ